MILVVFYATKNTYIQHNVQSHHVHTLMLYWTFVACNSLVHVGVKNEKNLHFVSISISQDCLCNGEKWRGEKIFMLH